MPELPDIETYLAALAPRVLGRPITGLRIRSAFVLRTVEPSASSIPGHTVQTLRRLGKRIVFGLDGDFFLDRVVRGPPPSLEFDWHGEHYRVAVPPALVLPAFLTIDGLAEPPPGDLVLVLRREPRLMDLFRRAEPFVATVHATPG